MVVSGFLTLLMALFEPAVEQLPNVNLGGFLNSSGAQTFLDWISVAGYMLPFDTLFTVAGIIIGLQIFRIVIAFFKSLWGVLPIA